MQTLKFLALPVIALTLWLGAATFTLTQLESMTQTTATAKKTVQSAPMVTAGR
ncbi:MAG: hypothetical protein Q8N23_06425 [Archangium sp.]|nr:hypothetical protein [Archangium sp.]MDP3152287.1 hypothetical protein [Archangium sp.]MDP3570683.1 hypothetical protein [Archangium sp.]